MQALQKFLFVLAVALMASGCRTLPLTPSLPVRNSLVRDQLVIYSDFDLPRDHRLLDELAAQRDLVGEKLDLPLTSEPIAVYLFNEPESYYGFIQQHYPDFPDRRAFFVETDTRLAVYAQWGERVAEDLRHEVAHGYLHAAVQGLPLWLDEGLAEYFEVPRVDHGLNRPHVDLLVEKLNTGEWQPDLQRLERIAASAELTQLDYAESWAWVHWLLESDPAHRAVLTGHVRALRAGGGSDASEPLSAAVARLHYQPAETLTEYIRTLQ